MIISYRNKAYLLFYEKFQKDKKANIADSRLDKFL